jgi:Protein of unknown function (DUF2934)
MSSIAELIRRADGQLRSQVNVAAGLTEAVAHAGLDEIREPHEALVAARMLLADRKEALGAAQRRVRQLGDAVSHLSHALPFLEEGWPQQRARLRDAISANAEDGLATWLNYWFDAASSHRLGALGRLQSEVPLPADVAVIGERLSVAARALDAADWLPCQEVLLLGATGVRVGTRQVPDRPTPDGRQPDPSVREGLRLLAARLALHNGLPDQADAALDANGQETAPRLALRSRSARLRGAGSEAESLLAQARDLDPGDLDVTVELIARARQRRDRDSAIDSARAASEALLSLSDVEGDIGRLVDPPTEIWVALAERARDEGDYDGARRLLDRATATAAWDDNEVFAAAEEVRATVATSAAERRRAFLLAGHWCANAGQLDRARRNYQDAAVGGGTPADPADAQVQAAARLRLADVISVTSRQRPYRTVEEELTDALTLVQEARPQPDQSGTGSWSYLTESDLRIQLSKVPGRTDRYEQEWAALLAAAKAVSFRPWASSWLALADAAMTRDLYLVAEAAAARAHEIEQNEATRAGYVRALINTGRYADALEHLGDESDPGNRDDPWRQCVRGLIALRMGRADEAVGHFTGLRIDPMWLWAWHSYIRALVIMGDVTAARRESAELMRAGTGREDERSWLAAAAFGARLKGQLDAARDIAERLSQAAGPDNVKALHARAEAQILGGDQAGWELLARALAADPRPAGIDVWEREDCPVLEALAAGQGFKLTPAHLEAALRQLRARARARDPVAELRLAAGTAMVAEASAAAHLTEAALRASSGTADPALEQLLDTLSTEDKLQAEAASLRRQIAAAKGQDGQVAEAPGGDSEVPAPERPVVRLRLSASWLAGNADRGPDLELRQLLAWARQRTELSGAGDLEPDGYQLLVADEVRASGHVDLTLRYCPLGAMTLLPERIRMSPRIVAAGHDAGIPADLLDGEHELAALLTRPAAEVIAAQYYQLVISPPVPRPIRLTVPALGYRCWELRGRPAGSAQADVHVARRVLHQFIAEDAYFRWEKRQGKPGDSRTDWFAAERDAGKGALPRPLVDERLRNELNEQRAYFHWEKRGRPPGSPWADWSPS